MSNATLISDVVLARMEKGLSVRQLGRETGVSFSTLARIERGDGKPSLMTQIALLQWLGRDVTVELKQLANQSFASPLLLRLDNLEFLVELLIKEVNRLQGHVHTVLPVANVPTPPTRKE